MEEQKMQELLKQLEDLKKEKKAEVKKEKTGTCSHDLRTAFINKFPQGLKGRKSFMLKVAKIDVMPSNVQNLIDWLRRNNQEDRADEIEENRDKFFDISIICDDGTQELFNSGILSYDKTNSLEKLVVKSGDGFEYYINTITWDADKKELIFA